MKAWDLVRVLLAYAYGVLPYLCLLSPLRWIPAGHTLSGHLAVRLTAATAALSLAGTILSAVSFDLFLGIHHLLAAAGAAVVLLQGGRRRAAPDRPAWQRFDPWLAAVLILAFLVRAAPILIARASLGGGDARFHNILAAKILLERQLADTWLPFAALRVAYPQGAHVLAALLAEWSGRPVHEAFHVLLCVCGVLTTGVLYRIARSLFGSEAPALWAASLYAFVAVLGSLDYFRWGGVPNALGMLMVCLLILALLENAPRHARRRRAGAVGGGLVLLAVLRIHHYSLLVAGLLFLFGLLFANDRALRRLMLGAATVALVCALPWLVPRVSLGADELAQTAVFRFREPPLTLFSVIQHMNPALVLAFVVALAEARRRVWTAPQLLILAWLAGMVAAFAALEYLYRAASLILTRGGDCFTALTPSRMATDLVYPMSLLGGFIPISRLWEKHRGACLGVLCGSAVLTCSTLSFTQASVGVAPDAVSAAAWLRAHTPTDSLIVGSLPHVEYLSWRETSRPPLPASEARRHPAFLWKTQRSTFREWFAWQDVMQRPLYFLLAPDGRTPPFLREVYSNPSVRVATTRENDSP